MEFIVGPGRIEPEAEWGHGAFLNVAPTVVRA